MQSQFDALQQWSDTWQLNISYFISFLYLDNRKNKLNVSMILGGENILQVSQLKDLGVVIDSELKFDKHINQIVSRARQVANLIHKCFMSKDLIYMLVQAYTTYVRSLLEYASSV